MSVLVALHHLTHYRYDRPIHLGPQIVRLCPAPHTRTRVSSYSLKVTPAQHFVNWQNDPNGNRIARFVFSEPAGELAVTVDLIADLEAINPFDFFIEPGAETFPFAYPPELRLELAACLPAEPEGPRLIEFLGSLSRAPRSVVELLVDLNGRLQRDIRYVTRMEQGVQTVEETLSAAQGSCRDTAWLLVQILRQLGLAARFVSGYLIQLKTDPKPDNSVEIPQDTAALHAWSEVYLPGAGWIGLDPTSGLLCGEGHLPLAAGAHYASTAPISGSIEPAEVSFSVEMQMTRIGNKA
jgi:transglutaminase-like putative cysteine protease